MSNKYHAALLKHNQQVPRYTSYPTAPHFKTDVGPRDVSQWLRAIPAEDAVSLYFHVPFCKSMCWYCGCNTKATRHYSPVSKYLEYLKKEITLVSERLNEKQPVRHIHFGGGSPSFIEPDDFRDLMHHVGQCFDILPEAEVAIELDPREITEPKVAAYAQSGINRVSLGVQDFHNDVQEAINRKQPYRVIYRGVELLRSYGIEAVSFDLLYGLPHQTVDIIRDNVSLAASMKPDRISLFGYAHVPWMKKHMKLIDEKVLPNGLERLEQFDAAKESLVERGYAEIGLDHFALADDPMAKAFKAGELHRNFQGYTTDSAPTLIGFGASAISAHKEGYCQNAPDKRSYYASIEQGELATIKGLQLTDDDLIRRSIIEQIMCYGEIDLEQFAGSRDLSLENFSSDIEKLVPLQKDGLVTVDDWHLKVDEEASQATRLAAAAFDTYLAPSKKQHAQVA